MFIVHAAFFDQDGVGPPVHERVLDFNDQNQRVAFAKASRTALGQNQRVVTQAVDEVLMLFFLSNKGEDHPITRQAMAAFTPERIHQLSQQVKAKPLAPANLKKTEGQHD